MATRVREPRALDTDDKAVVPAKLLTLATDAWEKQRAKNRADTAHRKAMKKLTEAMAKSNHKKFSMQNGDITVVAEYGKPETEYVDVEALASRVGGPAAALQVCSATKGAVTDLFGTNILNQCLKTKLGDDRAKLSEEK